MNKKGLTLVLLVASMALLISTVNAQPFGAGVTEVSTTRSTADAAGSDDALAGNITELSLNGYSITRTWQGYVGNVSGTIQLADASDNILYNWTAASPEGEVYASTNASISWTNIQCFNFTATGTLADDSANAGGTSQFGTNLSGLEAAFNIVSNDVDGVDETFTLDGSHENGGGFTHSLFYTNSLEFSAGECPSTHLFGSGGTVADADFEEVLLYDPNTASVVFTALLDEDVVGYEGATHDFEMLVLEDGHGTDTATTTYYFYVELE